MANESKEVKRAAKRDAKREKKNYFFISYHSKNDKNVELETFTHKRGSVNGIQRQKLVGRSEATRGTINGI